MKTLILLFLISNFLYASSFEQQLDSKAEEACKALAYNKQPNMSSNDLMETLGMFTGYVLMAAEINKSRSTNSDTSTVSGIIISSCKVLLADKAHTDKVGFNSAMRWQIRAELWLETTKSMTESMGN